MIWPILALIVCLSIWFLGSVLLPFVTGFIIAYLLNPVVNALAQRRVDRGGASLFLIVVFFAVLLLLCGLAAPVVISETKRLIGDIPGWIDSARAAAGPYIESLYRRLGRENIPDIGEIAKNGGQTENAAGFGGSVVKHIAAGGMVVFNLLSFLIVTPIVAFFMMREWPDITDWIESMIPPRHRKLVLDLWSKIDTKLAGFIRGQFLVASILGVAYAVSLSLAGLDYGFVIGLGAGILCIVPFVGSATGLVVASVAAWMQTGDLGYTAMIAGIFLAGQLIEGNFLTPKLVGDRVGLHPLWVFFALMAGGALFGILGVLVAVPIAAVISVILGYVIQVYKSGPAYTGNGDVTPPQIESRFNPPPEDGKHARPPADPS